MSKIQQELNKRIKALSDSHTLTNAGRIRRLTTLQSQLNQRLVGLAQHLHLVIPALRSSSIRPEEEALRTKLEELEMELRRPGGSGGSGVGGGRQKGKLNELWALIGVVQASREREGNTDGGNKTEWTVVDPDGLQRIIQVILFLHSFDYLKQSINYILKQILREQQNGITHLTKIVEGHKRDLDIIYGIPRTSEDNDLFNTPQARQVLFGTSSIR